MNQFGIRIGDGGQGKRPGLLQRVLGTFAGIVVLAGAFMLSAVVLAFVAATALAGGIYLWWRTRELRKQLSERMRDPPPPGGRIIEGEVIRDIEPDQRH
jgi:hypothetical protein